VAKKDGATGGIQTDVFEMLEVIFIVADPMVHKPLLPTNDFPMVAPPSTAAFFESRKKAFMYEPPSPWFLFMIYQLMRRRGRRRYRRIQTPVLEMLIETDVFEMLEVIFIVADPMVHKPWREG
jgi:hypothetical protein